MKQSDHSLVPGDAMSGLEAAELIEMRAIRFGTRMQNVVKVRHA